MRLLRPMPIVAIAVSMVCAFAGCSGRREAGSSSGEGGVSESSASTSTSTSGSESGSGGGTGVDASTYDAPEVCVGDLGVWEKLIAAPSLCQQASDCCVVTSGCLAQAQIVAAAVKDELSAAWPSCDLDCVDCVPPAIEVGCVAGVCRGRVVVGLVADPMLRHDHCGDDMKTVDLSGPSGVHFGCGN